MDIRLKWKEGTNRTLCKIISGLSCTEPVDMTFTLYPLGRVIKKVW